MAAMRLWYLACIAAFLALIAVVPASGSDEGEGMSAREAERLADFLILAVKPEGDERDYKLVEIGDTKINAGLLGVVINTLPLDFLGLGPADRDYNEAAEVAQCRAACSANSECRDFAYVRPSSSQPVGVCRLRRLAQAPNFGVMAPVSEPSEGASPKLLFPVPEKPAPEAKLEPQREKIPPPPHLAPPVAIFFPMPPRVTPTAPPTDITPPLVAEAPPVTQPAVKQPPATDVATTPAPARKRGLPLWLALGAIAAMLAGAGVYFRNHRARMLNRLTTRLVSDGIAGRTITIDLADDANHSLRFVVRAAANLNAPATRIELIPKGATA